MKHIKLLFVLTISFAVLTGIHSCAIAQDTISTPNPDGITDVYISFFVNNISELNSSSQVFKADILFTAKWNDPRLKHESKDRIIQSVDKVWDPFLTFTNRLNITKSFPENVTVLSDGTVIYFQRVYGEFTQSLNFEDFPFDTQQLKINLIAIGLNSNEVNLIPDTGDVSGINQNISLSDWDVTNWSIEKSTYKFSRNSAELPALTVNINVNRNYGYYFLLFIIPLMLIIMMSWMSFWLDPQLSSSQISIATTSMLTLIAYRFIVTGNLPRISYLTRMDLFILGSSLLIFLTLLESVLTAGLIYKEKVRIATKIDLHCRWIFPLVYFIIAVIAFAV